MNFFMVDYEANTQSSQLVADGFDYPISEGIASSIEDSTSETAFEMGVRPEHIHLVRDADDRSVEAGVDVIETVGSDNFIYLKIGDYDCTMRTGVEFDPDPGDTIEVAFEDHHIHLFKRDTGEAVTDNAGMQVTETQINQT